MSQGQDFGARQIRAVVGLESQPGNAPSPTVQFFALPLGCCAQLVIRDTRLLIGRRGLMAATVKGALVLGAMAWTPPPKERSDHSGDLPCCWPGQTMVRGCSNLVTAPVLT